MEPDAVTWVTLAKDFQTALVGIAGFTGVIIAQLVNGYLARKRDEDIQRTKNRAVTAAFRAEIKTFRNFFAKVDSKSKGKEGQLVHRQRLRRTVTPSLMNDFGHINTSSFEKVLYALLSIDASDANSALFAKETTDTHHSFDNESWPIVAGALNQMVGPLDEALNTLDSSD